MTRCEAKKAFREAASEEFLHIPAENEIEHEFSERFNRKMKKLLKKAEYKSTHYFSKSKKRIISLTVAIIIIIAGLMSVGAVRNAVAELVYEKIDGCFDITFDGDTVNKIDCR